MRNNVFKVEQLLQDNFHTVIKDVKNQLTDVCQEEVSEQGPMLKDEELQLNDNSLTPFKDVTDTQNETNKEGGGSRPVENSEETNLDNASRKSLTLSSKIEHISQKQSLNGDSSQRPSQIENLLETSPVPLKPCLCRSKYKCTRVGRLTRPCPKVKFAEPLTSFEPHTSFCFIENEEEECNLPTNCQIECDYDSTGRTKSKFGKLVNFTCLEDNINFNARLERKKICLESVEFLDNNAINVAVCVLKDLPHKMVMAKYTVDDWETEKFTYGRMVFDSSTELTVNFAFQIKVPSDVDRREGDINVEFLISCTCDDGGAGTYWDDNNGHHYNVVFFRNNHAEEKHL